MNHLGEVLEAPFTKLLLDHGANPNARASLRKQLHSGYGIDGRHVYWDVTPIRWGEELVFQKLVNRAAMRLIAEHSGQTQGGKAGPICAVIISSIDAPSPRIKSNCLANPAPFSKCVALFAPFENARLDWVSSYRPQLYGLR